MQPKWTVAKQCPCHPPIQIQSKGTVPPIFIPTMNKTTQTPAPKNSPQELIFQFSDIHGNVVKHK